MIYIVITYFIWGVILATVDDHQRQVQNLELNMKLKRTHFVESTGERFTSFCAWTSCGPAIQALQFLEFMLKIFFPS